MAIAARLKSLPARSVWTALAAAAALMLLSGLGAAPARAIVVTELGPKKETSAGLQQRRAPGKWIESVAGTEPAEFANPSGNPVLHGTATIAIYWDPTAHYHGDWQHVIDTFFRNQGAASGALGSVFAVDAQYTDKSNQPAYYRSSFKGAYTDTTGYPAKECTDPAPLEPGDAITCLTDTQVQQELQSFISQHGLPKGMGVVYYVLTPPGVTVCLDGGGPGGHCSDYESGAKEKESYERSFCSYHSDMSPTNPTQGDGNTILYGTIPWTAGGLADYHLTKNDRKNAFDCQDGGFDPSKSEAKESSPHPEEPNQIGLGPDGSYDTGLADLIINQVAVEQQNIVTNPLLNAWQDPGRYEATDECRNFFAPVLAGTVTPAEGTEAGTLYNQSINGGNYYVNDAFNLAGVKLPYPGVECVTHVNLVPQFTSPNPVNAGEIVALDGMESNITLNAAIGFSSGGAPQPNYATYVWNFGDGTPTVSGYAPGAPACSSPWLSPCAASAFHAYAYGGTYTVTLTVTDVAANTASVSQPVTVVGPPPPAPATASSGAGTQAGTAGGSSGGSGGGSQPTHTPTIAAAVASHSLRRVLRSGLVVRYAVNERVAGRFEVLLAKSVANRLGLHGPTVTGLAPGTPPQVVIGKAFLAANAGGHNTVTIQFSKSVAAHLTRLRGVSLMLRVVVRNASTGTATVLSTVTLSR